MKKRKFRWRFWSSRLFRTASLVLMGVLFFSLFFDVSPDRRDVCPQEIQKEILYWANAYRLPPELVSAVIWKESRYRVNAVGKSGEIGLMQLMGPGTPGAVTEWARLKGCPVPFRRNLFDVSLNLEIGCWHLARAMERWQKYRHGTALALAQYNAGAALAEKWKPEIFDGEVLPRITYPKTRDYVSQILKKYRQLRRKNRR